jgi:hypothetical protein
VDTRGGLLEVFEVFPQPIMKSTFLGRLVRTLVTILTELCRLQRDRRLFISPQSSASHPKVKKGKFAPVDAMNAYKESSDSSASHF